MSDTKKQRSGGPGARTGLQRLRRLLPVAILLVGGIGLAVHAGFGTLSDFGWMDVSLLCPLGSLGTMLASKTAVPHAVISLAIAIALIVLLGRAFCGWACPVPFVSKLRGAFSKKKKTDPTHGRPADELTADEKKLLARSCGGSCAEARSTVDSRHFVLGGALLSAAIFGFPVFCLICPIGLSFATMLLLIRAFGVGDVTWSLIIVPALLLAEVVFFRKWCAKICPLGALMSLVGKLNRTFRPAIDDAKCLETSKGRTCGACGRACPEGIDPRHPQLGASQMNECTRCRACADACPAGAITLPAVARKDEHVTLTPNDTATKPKPAA